MNMILIESDTKGWQQTRHSVASVILNVDDVLHGVEFTDVQWLLESTLVFLNECHEDTGAIGMFFEEKSYFQCSLG